MGDEKTQREMMDRRHRQGVLKAPWRMLESDHDDVVEDLRRLECLFAELSRNPENTSPVWREILLSLRRLEAKSRPHFRVEEQIVFPYLSRHAPALKKSLKNLIREHVIMKSNMNRCRHLLSVRSPLAHKDGTRLIRLLRRHIQKEIHLLDRKTRLLRPGSTPEN